MGKLFPKMGNYLQVRRYSLLYLIIGILLTLATLTSFISTSNQRLKSLLSYTNAVEHTYLVLGKIEELNGLSKEAETSVRGYALTGDSSYLAPYHLAREQFPKLIDSLKYLTSDNNIQLARIGILRNTILLRMKILEEAVTMIREGTYSKVMVKRMEKGREMMVSFRTELATIKAEEQDLLAKRYENKLKYERLTPSVFLQFSILTGVISIVLFGLLILELLRRLRYQKSLQVQVDALKQTNDELTQLAFAASHDLQEPVRKMRIFSDRLLMKQKHLLPAEEVMILGRIDYSAKRLQGMLEDISNYMNLVSSQEKKVKTDLHDAIQEVIIKHDALMRDSKTSVRIHSVPTLKVFRSQFQLLFQSLLDNAIKFSKPGVPPVLTIYSEELTAAKLKEFISAPIHQHYWVIHFSDNGIGFENVYREKIFQLFRKLHGNDEYTGKGIGLAICQRVMSNHEGFIRAIGKPGEGARFMAFFPIE